MTDGAKQKRRPGVRPPGALPDHEWKFTSIPPGLESDVLWYERLREVYPHAAGVTLECIRNRWPWWPEPWLTGWAKLSHAERMRFKVERVKGSHGFSVIDPILLKGQPVRETTDFEVLFGSEVNEPEDFAAPPSPLLLAAVQIERGRTLDEITEAFREWLRPYLLPRKDRRFRDRDHLLRLGAWRLARHAAGVRGLELFELTATVLARVQLQVDGTALERLGERKNLIRAINWARDFCGK